MKTTYSKSQIGVELLRTAQGKAFYGNALKSALDLGLTTNQHATVNRYLIGADNSSDRFTLQRLAYDLIDNS